MPETNIPGTSIKESSMEKMLRHNRVITGDNPDPAKIDHQRIAENLEANRPVLLPGVGSPAPRRTIRVSRPFTEGVDGTSPTPGQDNIDYIPPTTSNTADPGNSGKGPDAENEPASKGPISKEEQMMKDLGTLFGEADNPFAKKDKKEGEEEEEEEEGDENEGEEDDEDDDKDKKDKKKDDKEGVDEAAEVKCESCGYHETYDLSDSSIEEGNVPTGPSGELDKTCPMCGADMDLSMVGATDVAQISNPAPFTDERGNSGSSQRESLEAIKYAQHLTNRIVRGESVEAIAKFVITSDFLPRDQASA